MQATEGLLAGFDPQQLPPFAPPPGRPVPDWIRNPPPRTLPPEYVRRMRREKRFIVEVLLVLGAIALAAVYMPFTAKLGHYFLPLAYLSWVAWTLIGLGLFIAVLPLILEDEKTKLAYHGEWTWVRIERVGRGPKTYKNGKPDKYHYQALVSLPPWADGRPIPRILDSQELFGLDGMEFTYRPGDYVLAFVRGNDVQLYGFTGIDEHEGLLDRSGSGALAITFWLLSLGMFACLCVIALSAFRYAPLEFGPEFLIPVAMGLVVACGMIVVMLIRRYFAARAEAAVRIENEHRRREGGVIELGQPALAPSKLASLTSLLWSIGLTLFATPAAFLLFSFHFNAVFDRTPERAVEVDKLRASDQVIWYMIRLPLLHFTLHGSEQFIALSAEETARLKDAPRATLFVREGNFGWPWVDHVDPRP